MSEGTPPDLEQIMSRASYIATCWSTMTRCPIGERDIR